MAMKTKIKSQSIDGLSHDDFGGEVVPTIDFTESESELSGDDFDILIF